jgi:hypothetical protein
VRGGLKEDKSADGDAASQCELMFIIWKQGRKETGHRHAVGSWRLDGDAREAVQAQVICEEDMTAGFHRGRQMDGVNGLEVVLGADVRGAFHDGT